MTINKPNVQRYDDMGCPEEICRVDTMYESDDGDYVLYEDYEALQADHEQLRKALVEARDLVAEWGGYASDYFKEKHGLERDIARLDAVITAHRKQGGEE